MKPAQGNKSSVIKKKKRRTKSLTRRHIKNSLRLLPILGPFILTAFIYMWQHTRLNIVGLPIESLRARKMDLIKQNDSIRLRIEQLQAPQRIETIAHEKLGMSSPETWQVVALDQPMRAPRSAGETIRRAEGQLPPVEKPAKLLGFLKKRVAGEGASPKPAPPQANPRSG